MDRLLRAAIFATDGPVLELGAGLGSTLFLHELLDGTGRELVTIETNSEWYAKVAHLNTDWHRIQLVDDIRTCGVWTLRPWSVALVDHAPGEHRVVAIEHLRNVCEVQVVHDTEAPCYGWEPVISSFKYRVYDKEQRPWTTALSETVDVGSWLQ